MKQLFEDIFDDIHIDNEKEREITTHEYPTDPFVEKVNFYNWLTLNIPYAIRLFTRKVHFILNNTAFINTTVDKIEILLYANDEIPYEAELIPDSIFNIPVIKNIQTTPRGCVQSMCADIYFRTAIEFHTHVELYNTFTNLVRQDFTNASPADPHCTLQCYPYEAKHASWTNNYYYDINGEQRQSIKIFISDTAVISSDGLEEFYFTYVDNPVILDRLRSHIRRNGLYNSWKELFNSKYLPK